MIPEAELSGTAARGKGAQPLADLAYHTIKARILAFHLPPGSLVSAQDLADQIGVSVTPVHWALKRLCGEGLCRVIPRAGYVISSISLDDVQEIFSMRLALEPLAVDLGLRRATDHDLAAFREEEHRPMQPPKRYPGAPAEVWQLNALGDYHDAFHLAVARLSGLNRLVGVIRDLLAQGRRLTFMPSGVGMEELDSLALPDPELRGLHRVIAEAILARDRDAAVSAVAEHVRDRHRAVLNVLSPISTDRSVPGGKTSAHEPGSDAVPGVVAHAAP